MNTVPSRLTGADQTVETIRSMLGRLERTRPRNVLSVLVVCEWISILGVGLAVRHNNWLYYQGGDQLWHYVTAWLMGQGRLPHTAVGYGWAVLLLPFAAFGGPNLVEPLPLIILLNVLVLMPVALVAVYGIAERIGGRLFGYWAAVLWILVPLAGIKYTDAGYHQKYTELLLPQSLGLTVMADFPSMVVLAAAAYFTLRAAQGDHPIDPILGGLLAGVALGMKASNAPFLVGAGLVLLVTRRWRGLLRFTAALAPSLLVLAVWKARGEGKIPLFHSSEPASRLALGHSSLVGVSIHPYLHLSWSRFATQLDQLREHFWSSRLLEWIAIVGLIGLFRRSRPAALLLGGWFFTTFVVKWANPSAGTVEDSDLLRQMIPTIPAALLLIAGVPLVFPGLPKRLSAPALRAWGPHRLRIGLVGGVAAVFVLVPLALALALPPLAQSDTLSYHTLAGTRLSAPFAVDPSWRTSSVREGKVVRVSWKPLRPLGATMDYVVIRAPAGAAINCGTTSGGAVCVLEGDIVAYTAGTSAVDRPPSGEWIYRVGGVANWIHDPHAGDIYLVAPPMQVNVPG